MAWLFKALVALSVSIARRARRETPVTPPTHPPAE
jgi:hypothetical protein